MGPRYFHKLLPSVINEILQRPDQKSTSQAVTQICVKIIVVFVVNLQIYLTYLLEIFSNVVTAGRILTKLTGVCVLPEVHQRI